MCIRDRLLIEVFFQEDVNSAPAKAIGKSGGALDTSGMVPFCVMGRIHRKVVAGPRMIA